MYENRGVHAAAPTESTSTVSTKNTNAPVAPVPGSLGTMAGTVKAALALKMAGTAYFGEGMTMSNHTPGPWKLGSVRPQLCEIPQGSQMFVIESADEDRWNIGFASSWTIHPRP